MKIIFDRRSGKFIEKDRIRIIIDETEYELIETEDKELRIMKELFSFDTLKIIPEVSNVIRIS